MSPTTDDPRSPARPTPDPSVDRPSRWRAAAAAALLLLTGAALGVTVDRLWIAGSSSARAAPLTVDALVRSLELAPADQGRVRGVLDSLREEVAGAARAGPDSLRAVARAARIRLHRALPPEHRPAFRRWMMRHHRQMMERMHPDGRPGMRMSPGTSPDLHPHHRMHDGDSARPPTGSGPGGGPDGRRRRRQGGS